VANAYRRAASHVLRYEVAFRHFVEGGGRQPEKAPQPPFYEMTGALGEFLEEVRKFTGIVPAPLQKP
jgi:hypothetical protein